MTWHYIENGQQAGPVDEATFKSLISAGTIKPDTHVWRDGMANWMPYAEVAASTPAASIAGTDSCSECGNAFSPEDLIQIGGRPVCAVCKPIAVQKLKEGVAINGDFRYAGFWIRFGASFVDGLILIPLTGAYAYILIKHPNPGDSVRLTAQGLMYVVGALYSIFFLGKMGATPGMMACGIRVVRPDGEKDQLSSCARALLRGYIEHAGPSALVIS